MGRNEDSLLRAAGETALASATRGGSCAHPDQSRGLVHRHNMRAISGVGASSPILLFFIGGGVALHERLVGNVISDGVRPRLNLAGFEPLPAFLQDEGVVLQELSKIRMMRSKGLLTDGQSSSEEGFRLRILSL